jgi:chaperonin GroES
MTTIAFEPFGARIVVKPDADEEKKGGIVIPGTAKKEVVNGTVVAVGYGVSEKFSDLRDSVTNLNNIRVRFLAHTGYEIEVEGVKYLVLDEQCVLGRYTGKEV